MSNNKNNKDNDNFPYEIVFDKYKIEKKIGKGSFGTVYMAKNKENHEYVAIKTEINNEKIQVGLLESEAHKLTILKGYLGIPKIYNFGKLKGFNVLAMELLGKSLTDIFSTNNKKFSLKTVCTIAIDMIKLIQHVHEKKIIHRDIKPDNFMMGISKNKYVLYLIDFGLAKKYINSNGQHIPFKLGKSMTGTARYCSIYTHQGMEQSRRDDLESIGYVLMYFLRGDLPWQGIKVKENEKHYERIGNMKQSTSIDELCAGFPIQFINYFNYVKQLEFEDEPNYNLLIELFEVVLKKYCGVKYIQPSNSHRGNLFDWNHKNLNELPDKLKSKTLRNFTKGKTTNSSLNVGNGSNHSNVKDDKRRYTDSSFNNIKDTKDDTRGAVVTDDIGNSGKNKNKDVHCQCFIF